MNEEVAAELERVSVALRQTQRALARECRETERVMKHARRDIARARRALAKHEALLERRRALRALPGDRSSLAFQLGEACGSLWRSASAVRTTGLSARLAPGLTTAVFELASRHWEPK